MPEFKEELSSQKWREWRGRNSRLGLPSGCHSAHLSELRWIQNPNLAPPAQAGMEDITELTARRWNTPQMTSTRAFGEIHPTPEALKKQMFEIAGRQFRREVDEGWLGQMRFLTCGTSRYQIRLRLLASYIDIDKVRLRSSPISR